MFSEAMDRIPYPEAANRKKSFNILIERSHELRKYRNTLLHSAYVELKAGSEINGIMKVNPIIRFDDEGEYLIDIEDLTNDNLRKRMNEFAEMGFELGNHYVQLIHWSQYLTNPKRHG